MQQFERTIDRRGDLLLQIRRRGRERLRINRPVVVEAHIAGGFGGEMLVEAQHFGALVDRLGAGAGQQIVVGVVRIVGIVVWCPGSQNCSWSSSGEGVEDAIDRRGAGNGRNERCAGYVATDRIAPLLPVGFRCEEEEGLVANDGTTERSAELIQTQRLLRFAVRGPEGFWRVKSVIAQELEEASVKAVGARRRADGQLRAAGCAFFGACRQRVDAELRDSVEGNGEAHPGALRLIHDVGCIDAVIGEVAVVEAPSGKANRPLVASAGVDGAGDECRQRRPVAAIERQFVGLRSLDQAGHRACVTVHERRSSRNLDALLARRHLQGSH